MKGSSASPTLRHSSRSAQAWRGWEGTSRESENGRRHPARRLRRFARCNAIARQIARNAVIFVSMKRVALIALLLLFAAPLLAQEPDYAYESWTHLLQTYYDPAHGLDYGH